MSGHQEKAEAILCELLGHFPDLNLDQEYQHHSTYYENYEDIEHLLTGMRKAGLS
jgi:hypothetical protein